MTEPHADPDGFEERRNPSEDELQAGLDRLRASKFEQDDKLQEEGRALGLKFALTNARADEVERLAALNDEEGGFMAGQPWAGSWLTIAAAAFADVDDPRDVDSQTVEAFLKSGFGRTKPPPDALLLGVVEGVVEIRDQI